jgi:hypothetical protein
MWIASHPGAFKDSLHYNIINTNTKETNVKKEYHS